MKTTTQSQSWEEFLALFDDVDESKTDTLNEFKSIPEDNITAHDLIEFGAKMLDLV